MEPASVRIRNLAEGAIVHDTQGREWVYIGTTAGIDHERGATIRHFVNLATGKQFAVTTHRTLVEHFPDAQAPR